MFESYDSEIWRQVTNDQELNHKPRAGNFLQTHSNHANAYVRFLFELSVKDARLEGSTDKPALAHGRGLLLYILSFLMHVLMSTFMNAAY